MASNRDCTTSAPHVSPSQPDPRAAIWVSDLTDLSKHYYSATAKEGQFVAWADLQRDNIYHDSYNLTVLLSKRTRGPIGPRQEERYGYLRQEARRALLAAMTAAGWGSEELVRFFRPTVVYRKPQGGR